ncbi:helix-turn-helix transcriptional regulator [Roseibium limicola]|uniref:Helix-turn-helix domain-containing protein n=1 Tax=Roseibium limicola TaxID=2816037 RepID=A0A939EMK6_9HYPH|nr:AraC family transcriptional regulator [Roseibium limicola]MBO0343774.1 helix-turn-helix domain-containing protein [Roseibium limicola]
MLQGLQELSRIESTAGCGGGSAGARIHGGVLLALDAYVRPLGFDLNDLVNELGLSFGAPSQWQQQFISLIDFSQLLDFISRRLHDPYVGLHWCTRSPVFRGRLIGLAARYAQTPLDSLQLIAHFMSAALDLKQCEVQVEGREVSFVWSFSPLVVRPEHLSDCVATEIANCFRSEGARSGFGPLRVEVCRARPEPRGYYANVLGAPVQFGTRGNRVVFDLEVVSRPRAGADALLFDALTELVVRRLADMQQHKDFVTQVCDVILAQIENVDLNLEWVAREIGMSPRVLQRRLAENGATFQGLYDRMRRELASELLRNTEVPISEISYRVGFSAVGNFTRAAKRWFGQSPKRWRQAQAPVTH